MESRRRFGGVSWRKFGRRDSTSSNSRAYMGGIWYKLNFNPTQQKAGKPKRDPAVHGRNIYICKLPCFLWDSLYEFILKNIWLTILDSQFLKNYWQNLLGLCHFLQNTQEYHTDRRTDSLAHGLRNYSWLGWVTYGVNTRSLVCSFDRRKNTLTNRQRDRQTN